MTHNFTHLKINFSESKILKGEVKLRRNPSAEPKGPSDSVIKNLLNFSKSLTIVTERHSGNVHMILLN